MNSLPTGTVSLLFSDIEGSTGLLSRLGPAYAEALDGQRQVLRKAWVEHGGSELGTEGDSFYVVFATAEGAVTAAAQAQRELAAFAWPSGEQVRVRIGIHTGAPTPHDGAYVGMDVHRAARIAGAAHGGQVLVSSATAELVGGCLPNQVVLRDLGSHQLKDIAQAEHLFQLAIEGLPSEFPPPKTLGAASSLPRPATPLVGRDGELAELTALLSSPEVRLVTLTGAGGSGKTRLAIGVAERLREQFPDGVFFVPLAAVTTAEVMWASIAEVLDVPPEGRIPPGFFEHVAHRTALFVLDNLEQVSGADAVAAELLAAAPQAVVIATSRKPLAVPAEHVHPVPPLELPQDASFGKAQAAGAVQMFVQHARKVKPSFTLTRDNAGDVTAVCRRLDGLPLAIELAAARTRLLSPKALLGRLDTALDLAAAGTQALSRQKTLRDTIAWSHDLLTAKQQMFFRRLGVFAGGADLDAISAVTTSDDADGTDPFDLVADLADASLATVSETPDGEPRVGMLEMIRTYALDQLNLSGEVDEVRDRHAQYYLAVAEQLRPLMDGNEQMVARASLEIEHENFREALGWTLPASGAPAAHAARVSVGVNLCPALAPFWLGSGYLAEMLQWMQRAVACSRGSSSPEVARLLQGLAESLRISGDLAGARAYATESIDMWRSLGLRHTSRLPVALAILAIVEVQSGNGAASKALLLEALEVAERINDQLQLGMILGELALQESAEHDYEASLRHAVRALGIAREIGAPTFALASEQTIARTLRLMGQVSVANEQMHALLPQILQFDQPLWTTEFAEDWAALLADLRVHRAAVRLLGAADISREHLGAPRDGMENAIRGDSSTKTRAGLTPQEWEAAYQAGRDLTVEEALTEAHAASGAK